MAIDWKSQLKSQGLSTFNPLRLTPEWINDQIRAALIRKRGGLPRPLRVSRGEIALQIGTPNPLTMAYLSNAVGRGGSVVIVEPAPTNLKRLEGARDQLTWSNVRLVRCAAWSETTELDLSIAAHPGDHKIEVEGIEHDNDFRPENKYEEKVCVRGRKVDDIVSEENLKKVNYIEVMVNGAELEVLRGAERLLQASRPIRLLVKGHARSKEDGNPINERISRFLESFGLNTVIAKGGETSVGSNKEWKTRAGDVFAYASK
jgi:FkbM family methyltransferase